MRVAGRRTDLSTLFAVHRLARHPWIAFTVLRLLLFLVPLVIALGLGASGILAAVLAAVISLALSVIFLPSLRSAMASGLAARASASHEPPARDSDESAEDEAIDRASATANEATPSEATPSEAPRDAVRADQATENTSAKPTP